MTGQQIPLSGARPRNERGFTMVEMVIAMMLVGLFSIGLIPLLWGITQHTVTNKDVLEATQLARQKLTEVQALAPSDPTIATSCIAVANTLTDTGVDPETGFHYSYSTPGCPAASGTNYPGTLAVTVTIKSGDLSKQFASLTTKVRVSEHG